MAGEISSDAGVLSYGELLEPVVARYRSRARRRYFRAAAAFASPEVHAYPEAEGFLYAIRQPGNQVHQRRIPRLPARPFGWPRRHVRRYYFSFDRQARSRGRARRVVANFMRTLVPRRAMARWSPTTLGEKQVKNGARMARHDRCVRFQMAEVTVSGRMFGHILVRIACLRAPPVPA